MKSNYIPNGYVDNAPYRFNRNPTGLLRIVTNKWVIIAVLFLIMALFVFGDKL